MKYLKSAVFLLVPCIFLSILNISSVMAAVVYTYTGNTYTNFYTLPSIYDGSMNISGSFTVDSKLISINGDISNQVASYHFTDGVNVYSDADPEGSAQFIVNTDSAGNITDWIVDIFDISSLSPTVVPGDVISRVVSQSASDDDTQVYECDFIVVTCVFTQIDGAQVIRNPGSWSVVPIPPAIWLFGSGLLGLIGISKRKKQLK